MTQISTMDLQQKMLHHMARMEHYAALVDEAEAAAVKKHGSVLLAAVPLRTDANYRHLVGSRDGHQRACATYAAVISAICANNPK